MCLKGGKQRQKVSVNSLRTIIPFCENKTDIFAITREKRGLLRFQVFYPLLLPQYITYKDGLVTKTIPISDPPPSQFYSFGLGFGIYILHDTMHEDIRPPRLATSQISFFFKKRREQNNTKKRNMEECEVPQNYRARRLSKI